MKFKVRHKNKYGQGRPSKEMKLMESIINEPRTKSMIERCTKMLMTDNLVYGGIREVTLDKIADILVKHRDSNK